jgi:hypothetical protein
MQNGLYSVARPVLIPEALLACCCPPRWVLIGEKLGRNPKTVQNRYLEMTTVANPNKGGGPKHSVLVSGPCQVGRQAGRQSIHRTGMEQRFGKLSVALRSLNRQGYVGRGTTVNLIVAG